MRIGPAAGVLGGVFLLVYLPDVGHGFVKDDFAWIAAARVETWRDAIALLAQNVGFYRPLVTATFAMDHAFWQLNPSGYGISNFALAVTDAALLFLLARRLSLAAPAALAAAAVWAFNFHGVNMAILWLSGRTALLLVLFALLAALAFLRGRHVAAGACCLCAMLCKEEAVLLPLLWTVFAAIDTRHRSGPSAVGRRLMHALAATWPMWAAAIVYAMLRGQSGAFTPSDAPDYYHFTIEPRALARNIVEYADRAGTVAAAVTIVLLTAARWKLAAWTPEERRCVVLGALWCVAGFGLTVFLPLRSSLYAVMPSIGCALIAGAAGSLALRTQPAAFTRVSAALVVLAVLLTPVYRTRNVRWVGAADLSSELRAVLEDHATRHPAGGTVVLVDDTSKRINFSATFDTQFPKAATLFMGPHWSGGIAGTDGATADGATVSIQLKDLANGRR
jgi:hypothetical protein